MDADHHALGGHLLAELLRDRDPIAEFGGVQVLDLHGELPRCPAAAPPRLDAADTVDGPWPSPSTLSRRHDGAQSHRSRCEGPPSGAARPAAGRYPARA